MKEFRNFPFSIPIGEGSFRGLTCPACNEDRFTCKNCLEQWLLSTFDAYLLWAIEQARPDEAVIQDDGLLGQPIMRETAKAWNAVIHEYTARLKNLVGK